MVKATLSQPEGVPPISCRPAAIHFRSRLLPTAILMLISLFAPQPQDGRNENRQEEIDLFIFARIKKEKMKHPRDESHPFEALLSTDNLKLRPLML